MGEIRAYSCSCGFQKEIFAGAGLNGCNLDAIKRFFPKEATQFEKERQVKKVQSYLLGNAVVECPHCENIETVPCFTYRTKEATMTYIKEECPVCGKQTNRVEEDENVSCPKCGAKMMYTMVGEWD